MTEYEPSYRERIHERELDNERDRLKKNRQEGWQIFAGVVLGLVVVALLILTVGLTTHETKMKSLDKKADFYTACVKSEKFTAADCRVIWAGGYNG